MRRSHRSKRAALLAALALGAAACSRDAPVTTRTVTLHVPRRCAVDSSAYAQYFELGDFEPGAPTSGHVLDRIGEPLPEIAAMARALLVEATKNSRTWSGTTALPAAGNVDALVLPTLLSCPFWAGPDGVGKRNGSTLATIASERVLLVGGDPGALTYVLGLDTGQIATAKPDMLTPRQGASVTPFGAGGLVAGGLDPRSAGRVQATAEVFVPELGGFDQSQLVTLSGPRMDHGAVVLATGETLLVGGVNSMGGQGLLDSMEAIDPATHVVRSVDIARLQVARRIPTALRLASGEILVAGGFDAAGVPVPTIEWFSPDATRATRMPHDLVAGSVDAFVALDGGGALAIVGPPPGAPAGFQSVWVIGADGKSTPATPLGGTIAQPVLFHGAGGAPVLWTGGADGRWLRWEPWQGAFGVLGVLDVAAAQVGGATASPDPGFALWLDEAAAPPALTALRFDTRGEYSPLAGPLLVGSAADVAPDRLAGPGVASFDPSVGLALGPGASAFVTDRTYADATIDVDAPTGEAPLVVLRDELGAELEVGGLACPVPFPKAATGASLHVQRSGASVQWAVGGGPHGACPGGVRVGARLSVGLRAPASAARSVARNLRILRVGP